MSTNSAVPALASNAESPTLADYSDLPPQVTDHSWGVVSEIQTTDISLSKIYHQQALSEFVKAERARPGDFCDSLTGEVLAKRNEPLEALVFGVYKSLLVKKRNKQGKWELERTILVTSENAPEIAALPFIEEKEDGEYQNNLTYNFYVLLPSRPEMPYIFTLGSTKTKVAKKLNAMIYRLSTMKRPGASVVFEFRALEESNEQGTWWGLDVAQGRNATAEELARAYAWHERSQSHTIKAVGEVPDGDDVPF